MKRPGKNTTKHKPKISCGGTMTPGKRRYSTLSEVQYAVELLDRKRNTQLFHYRCPECKGHHLTSRPPKVEVPRV